MTSYRAGTAGTVLGVLLLASCGPQPGHVSPRSEVSDCRWAADTSATMLDTVVVVLPGPFRADSLGHPRTLAERFVARHLTANLVTIDCSGTVRSELASEWKAEAEGTGWIFTLRPARETGVTPEIVRAQWDAKRNGGFWPWPAILGVEVVDSLRLRVRLDRSSPELPPEFADPMLAVRGGAFRSGYTVMPGAGPVTLTTFLVPRGSGPVIKVEVLRPGIDARDALDYPRAGLLNPADVVITRDAATVAYARNRREFTVAPVAWDPTYVLLTPVPSSAPTLVITDETRRGLLSDVVPGEVRVAAPPFWWDSMPCVATFSVPSPDPRDGPLIAFVGSDPIARALAQRLAAVATTHTGPRTVATDSATLDFGRATRPPSAFVLSLPRRRPASCTAVTSWPPGSRIDPLVDLHTFAIVRRGVPPIVLESDGLIRFSPRAQAP